MFGVSEQRVRFIVNEVGTSRLRGEQARHTFSTYRSSDSCQIDLVKKLYARVDDLQDRIVELEIAHDPEALRSDDV